MYRLPPPLRKKSEERWGRLYTGYNPVFFRWENRTKTEIPRRSISRLVAYTRQLLSCRVYADVWLRRKIPNHTSADIFENEDFFPPFSKCYASSRSFLFFFALPHKHAKMMQIRWRHLQSVRCMVCNIILFEGRRACPIRFSQISSLCGRFLKTCVFSVKKGCLRVDERLKGEKMSTLKISGCLWTGP